MWAIAVVSTLGFSPAAADVRDDQFGGEADDLEFIVTGTSHLSYRVDDGDHVSTATQAAITTLYEENDVNCALRQYTDEDGNLGNEDSDLCPEVENGPTTADVVALEWP